MSWTPWYTVDPLPCVTFHALSYSILTAAHQVSIIAVSSFHGPSSSVSASPFASSLTQCSPLSFWGLCPVTVHSTFPFSSQPAIQKYKSKLYVGAYTCNPSTQESGAERSRFQGWPQTQVPGQSEQHSKTMSQDKNKFFFLKKDRWIHSLSKTQTNCYT